MKIKFCRQDQLVGIQHDRILKSIYDVVCTLIIVIQDRENSINTTDWAEEVLDIIDPQFISMIFYLCSNQLIFTRLTHWHHRKMSANSEISVKRFVKLNVYQVGNTRILFKHDRKDKISTDIIHIKVSSPASKPKVNMIVYVNMVYLLILFVILNG